MRSVKGILLKIFIKSIRANKSGVYDNMITEEDKRIVNQRILDSSWYPYETFKNCFTAVFKVEAKENLNTVIKWGYNYGKQTLERIYKEPMKRADLKSAVDAYNLLFKSWFDFGTQYGELLSDTEVNIVIEDFDRDFIIFYYVAMGWMQSFLEVYLGKKVVTKFLEKSWEGSDKTVFNVTWKS